MYTCGLVDFPFGDGGEAQRATCTGDIGIERNIAIRHQIQRGRIAATVGDGRLYGQIACVGALTRRGHGHRAVVGQITGNIVSLGSIDGDIDWVDQPFPARALRRPGVSPEAGKINIVARGFNTPALTRARRFGLHTALCGGFPARLVHIAPQHHLAAIAVLRGVGGNASVFVHIDAAGLAHVATALPAAAHIHGATACGAIGFDLAACFQI
ncbi:hypothetical protein [Amphibiibacter pelophylacis]|uniref:Uncharacterized protein n=1 Tax=Amphibiibacter pelophylacis TaxID=1799477 RepID=A0ACC6NZ00_9BURK